MTDDQPPHDWQLLSCICNSIGRLDHPLYWRLTHDDYPREYRLMALEIALRSGAIPMRGRRVTSLGLEAPERIETKIDSETTIDIPLDEIILCKVCPETAARLEFAVFKHVEANQDSVEQWLLDAPGARKQFPLSRMPELKSFVLDFDRQQESAGGSRSEDTAWHAAKEHFGGFIITRGMMRDARSKMGCLGKPGKKPIHAAK